MSSLIGTLAHWHILIMAFLTLRSANIFNRNTIHFTGYQVMVELFVNAIEFIPVSD